MLDEKESERNSSDSRLDDIGVKSISNEEKHKIQVDSNVDTTSRYLNVTLLPEDEVKFLKENVDIDYMESTTGPAISKFSIENVTVNNSSRSWTSRICSMLASKSYSVWVRLKFDYSIYTLNYYSFGR